MPTRIPRMIPGQDVRKLPLTPTDGYLLTRVNGTATVRDIARETGLYEPEVIESFEKLVKLNVVTFGSVAEALAALNPPAPLKAAVLTAQYDEAQLQEECDLDVEQRRRVLELFYSLEDNDYYTLLGVAKEADKKAIKKAYYDVALPMHPDKFFRKNLGSFKPKMEAVFAKLTLGHDILIDKEKRAEYDIYLKDVANTKGMEAMLARAMDEARAAQEAAMKAAAATPQSVPPAPNPSAPPPPAPGVDPAVLAARRQALAARLMGGRGRVSAPTPIAEIKLGPSVQQTPQAAMDALRRRFDDRLSDAKAAQVARYVEAAEQSAAKNDWVAASNAYRIARDLSPDDLDIRARSDAAQTEANAILGESYSKQANYEESNGRFPEAARSWTRVAKLRPTDPHANERAASCILKAEGDLHEAAEFAKIAVQLKPTFVGPRLTLTNIYLAANKPALAKRELEAAAVVNPNDANVQNLLKRMSK